MTKLSFESKLEAYKDSNIFILNLPKSISQKMPSRGMVMVNAAVNTKTIEKPLEPDGKGGHFLIIDNKFIKNQNLKIGDSLSVDIEIVKDWTEPRLPKDLKKVLDKNSTVHATWLDITPMARWDWIRWISSTKNPDTRARRINIAMSKLKSGKRRPCCFNRSECILPYLV